MDIILIMGRDFVNKRKKTIHPGHYRNIHGVRKEPGISSKFSLLDQVLCPFLNQILREMTCLRQHRLPFLIGSLRFHCSNRHLSLEQSKVRPQSISCRRNTNLCRSSVLNGLEGSCYPSLHLSERIHMAP